jgi:hypothetical protein
LSILSHRRCADLISIHLQLVSIKKLVSYAKSSINILIDTDKSRTLFNDIRSRFDDGERARKDDGSKAVEFKYLR